MTAALPPLQLASTCTPVVLGAADEPILGWHHAPSPAATPRGALVLCNPLALELMSTHRTIRTLATHLADAGFHVLRFDYRGTGDSARSDEEPGRFAGWLASIDAAIDWMRGELGAERIDLVGLRAGASLAAIIASRRSDIGALVLWAPVVSGRRYVRELRVLHAVNAEHYGLGDTQEVRADGSIEATGYIFPRDTAAALIGMDLLKVDLPAGVPVLLLERDDAPREEQLAARLQGSGCALTRQPAPDYAAMMQDPHYSRVPRASIDAICTWLGALPAMPAMPLRRSTRAAPDAGAASYRQGEVTIRETVEIFGGSRHLVGVLSIPQKPAARSAVILLNVGANHRVGSHRVYVELARRLAAQGVAVLRMDVAGIGDGGPLAEEAESPLYSTASLPDVTLAMDHLGAAHGLERFTLVGLCSGAYLAFHSALRDARVQSQVLVNLQTFEWRPGASLDVAMRRGVKPLRYYVEHLFRGATWRRLLRGEVDFAHIGAGVAGRLLNRLKVRARNRIATVAEGERPASNPARFAALSARGVRSLMVFGTCDGGLDEMQTHLGVGARALRRDPNFRLLTIPGADHTFSPRAARAQLLDAIQEHVLGGG